MSAVKPKVFKGRVPVGTVVVFYPQANVHAPVTHNSGPIPAIVGFCDENGFCDLTAFERNGMTSKKNAVYPVGHQDTYEFDTHQVSGAGYHHGCWDFADVSDRLHDDTASIAPKAGEAVQADETGEVEQDPFDRANARRGRAKKAAAVTA